MADTGRYRSAVNKNKDPSGLLISVIRQDYFILNFKTMVALIPLAIHVFFQILKMTANIHASCKLLHPSFLQPFAFFMRKSKAHMFFNIWPIVNAMQFTGSSAFISLSKVFHMLLMPYITISSFMYAWSLLNKCNLFVTLYFLAVQYSHSSYVTTLKYNS